ncbi:MAG: DUF445 domain-containing protein [Catenisphaera adipataccumulans]|jgi:uncharacterized membrane protein YheB (UPF0754 family)|uniref:DUF445 domain-containing protein n=1 Tax=Catenisphaera adipataccumulans TaxID=700500 RepID=UPI003D8CCF71
MNLQMWTGPLIGALIGYCTNYIAVKMLFYPRREIRLFGFRLPFTPGAVPKGKARIAKAAGAIVSEQLMSVEDVRSQLIDSPLEKLITDKIRQALQQPLSDWMPADTQPWEKLIAGRIEQTVNEADIHGMVQKKASEMIAEKTKGSFVGRLLSDGFGDSMAGMMADEVEKFVAEEGPDYIEQAVHDQVYALRHQSLHELMTDGGLDEDRINERIHMYYRQAVDRYLPTVLETFHVSGMVEEKINAMSVKQVEDLVLMAMNKELTLIIRLGALIGFVLGCINLIV